MKQTVPVKGSIRRIAIGAGVALILYIALLALAALLIVRGTVGESAAGVCVWVAACLAAFAGAKTVTLGAGEAILPAAVCVAAFWVLIQLLGFFSSDTLEPGSSLALALPILAGGVLACLLRGGKKKKGKRNRRSHK